MNLAQRAARGVLWAYATFFGGKLVTLVVTALLARLLNVSDFGLWGVALLFIALADAVGDFGIGDALIYNTDREDDTATTAFWLGLALGGAQFAAVYALAPLAAQLPGASEDVIPVVRVLGSVFIINALGATHNSLLQKALRFRERHLPEFYSALIKGVITLLLAVWLRSVWALVIGQLIGAGVRVATRWMLVSFRPRFTFYPGRARVLWGYGAYVAAAYVVSVALDQADQAAIAVLIGVTAVGYYTIGARVPELVIANFSLVLTRVTFPVFARLADDRPVLTNTFLAITRYTVFVTAPVGLGLAAIAPELVLVVFGERWLPAIGLVQVLALLQLAYTLPWAAGDALKAAGRPDIITRLLAWEALYTFPVIVGAALLTREAFWASGANALAALVTAVVRLWITARFLAFHPRRYLSVFRGAFAAAAGMLIAVEVVRWLTSPLPMLVTSSREGAIAVTHTPPLALAAPLSLLLAVIVGGLTYALLLWRLEKSQLRDVWVFMRGALQNQKMG